MTGLRRNVIEDQLEKYHRIRIAKEEVNAVANGIYEQYLDDDVYETEQFVRAK
jgi:hypothetical protein